MPPTKKTGTPATPAHPAQVVVWIATSLAILAGGVWTVFVYLRPPSAVAPGPSGSRPSASVPTQFLDLVVSGEERLALTADRASPEYLVDPNGNRFNDSNVQLVRYRGNSEIKRVNVARLFIPVARHAIMEVNANLVRVFLVYKAVSGVYETGGTLFEHDRASLTQLRANTLFIGRNWGWFSHFDRGDVMHFSYDGCHWVRNAEAATEAAKDGRECAQLASDAEAAHVQAVRSHSDGVLELRAASATEAEQWKADEAVGRWLGITPDRLK